MEFLHFRAVDSSEICGMRGFSGSHRSDALSSGASLVGPLRTIKDLGFSPCASSLPGECISCRMCPEQGLKPNSLSVPLRPD